MHSLAAAETACKAAKDRGRNRVEVYQAQRCQSGAPFADINIVGQLRAAIDADRLWLAAQLIVPLAGAGSPQPHYELLLRMLDEDGHTVGPDRFLSAANRYHSCRDRSLGHQEGDRDAQAARPVPRRDLDVVRH